MNSLEKLKRKISFEELSAAFPDGGESFMDEESVLALEECITAHEKIVSLAEGNQLDKITFDEVFSKAAGHLRLDNDVTPSFEDSDGEPTKENFIKASLKKVTAFIKSLFAKLKEKFKKKTEESSQSMKATIAEMKKIANSDQISMEAFGLFGLGKLKTTSLPFLTLPNGKLAKPDDVMSALKYGYEKIAPAAYSFLTAWEDRAAKKMLVDDKNVFMGTADEAEFKKLNDVCQKAGKAYNSKSLDHFIGDTGILVTFAMLENGTLMLFLINHVRIADRYGDKVKDEVIELTPELKDEWKSKINQLVDDMVKLQDLATKAVNDANKGLNKVEEEAYKILTGTHNLGHREASNIATWIRNALLDRSTHIVQFYGSLCHVTSMTCDNVRKLCK